MTILVSRVETTGLYYYHLGQKKIKVDTLVYKNNVCIYNQHHITMFALSAHIAQ